MKKYIIALTSIVALSCFTSLRAQELITFEFEGANGVVTLTQDIPEYFLGNYISILPKIHPGKLLLAKTNKSGSFHWWNDSSRSRRITWGVLVKNGKVVVQRVTPPNSAYKAYDRLKLIIRYEDENLDLVAWGLYRAKSGKYGTRIVAGQYIKE